MVVTSTKAQSIKIDSLKALVSENKKDSTTVIALNNLAKEILNGGDIEGSLVYSNQAMVLSDEIPYLRGKAYALKNIGLAKYYEGNYFEVLDNWKKSLETFEIIKDSLGIANTTGNLGAVFYSQGSHERALEYYFRSLDISEKLNDPLRITTALVNIGGVYSQIPDYEKALEYFRKIEKFLPELNDQGIQSAYLLGVGEILGHRGEYEEAIKYYNQALEINKDAPDVAHKLTLLGKAYFALENSEKASEYLEAALLKAKEVNSPLDEVQTLLELGNLYQKSDPKRAVENYHKGEALAIEMETNEELRDVYKGISLTYQATGDFKNAYLYQNKFLELKDKIFNSEILERSNLIAADFDLMKKQDEIGLLEKEAEILELNERRQKNGKYISFAFAGLILLLTIGLFKRYKYVQKTKKIIEEEKLRSDKLLLNILPEETALELKQNGKVKAKKFDAVTVLFTDFKGFTHYAESLSPEELVETIDFYFSKFDQIMEKYDLEKIKTVGDAYMCAGGLHSNIEDHAHKMMMAGLEIMEFVKDAFKNKQSDTTLFEVRIGMNSGPVVAGVVGTHKFAYDIWGDTVNVASRMESNAEPGRINISENTYQLVKNDFECEYRGELAVKNRGMMRMYYVVGLKNIEPQKSLKESEIEI
tara:strand:- start:397374 stop:399314 length:1941 start_codon:yes stop_codon:yes gene_type:complete